MDISKLSEKELRDLNHEIVERLRFLQQTRAHKVMLNFNIGAAVCFGTDGGVVTVVTQEGARWNVSPSLLAKVNPVRISVRDVTPPPNVIDISPMSIRGMRSEFEVNRNAPCPCGSGRKYKRCCLPDEHGTK